LVVGPKRAGEGCIGAIAINEDAESPSGRLCGVRGLK
jgi:hypothetical protein